MKKFIMLVITMLMVGLVSGCVAETKSSDTQQREQQDRILAEGTAQTGMPAIKNFRERKMLKDIIEMRDQDGLVTYTYIVPEMTGKLIFLCNSIGYGIPAATQYTSKVVTSSYKEGMAILPQADPNGLFSPSSAEGTWVQCKDPNGDKVRPTYIEPRVIVSPFKMD